MSHAHEVPASDGVFARAQAGDPTAWEEIFVSCYPKLLKAIRRRYDQGAAIRSLYDTCDFANDVWKSLAEKPAHFDFANIDEVTAFMIHAAKNRLHDAQRKHHCQKRDIHRNLGDVPGDGQIDMRLGPRDETPSMNIRLAETRDMVLESTVDARERRIVEMKSKFLSNEEIGSKVGLSPRQVQRILEGVRKRVERREARSD